MNPRSLARRLFVLVLILVAAVAGFAWFVGGQLCAMPRVGSRNWHLKQVCPLGSRTR